MCSGAVGGIAPRRFVRRALELRRALLRRRPRLGLGAICETGALSRSPTVAREPRLRHGPAGSTDQSAAMSPTSHHRADRVERRTQRIHAVRGIRPHAAGFNATSRSTRRREPHRAAGVGADREVAEPAARAARVAARGAAGRAARMRGIVDGAVPRGSGRDAPRELGEVRLPDDVAPAPRARCSTTPRSVRDVVGVDLDPYVVRTPAVSKRSLTRAAVRRAGPPLAGRPRAAPRAT